MTDKDPKDMTASEILMRNADDNWSDGVAGIAMALDVEEYDGRVFELLANKIDAELSQARELSLRRGAELWAKANGWPDFRDGEDFGAWLERCTYKKPVDDCNEPVQFGDEIELHSRDGGVDKGRLQEVTVNRGPVWIFSFTGVDHELLLRYDNERDTIKRPAPEVLGADGKPIVEGEKVYRTDDPITEAVVTGFRGYDDGSIDVVCSEKGGKVTAFYSPSLLTHTPPDTQQRIDEDITLSPIEYCADILKLPNFDVMD